MSVEVAPPDLAVAPARWRAVAGDYLALTKPRIIELLLITTVPAMVVAGRGWPDTGLVAATLAGGSLASGSAHATNMVLDRDIDGKMSRTARRPLPTGRLAVRDAAVFAAALLVASLALLFGAVGPLATGLTAVAWLWYVGVYTLWLKRRSVHNIVVGGLAGALPPMIGWAAVTGTLGAPAVVLVAIVVLWTPTHFWSLAIATGADYGRAGVPMLPTVAGPALAARHSAGYAAATVAGSLALPFVGVGGWPLLVAALVLGAVLILSARGVVRDPQPERAKRHFHLSNGYLAALFVTVGASVLWS